MGALYTENNGYLIIRFHDSPQFLIAFHGFPFLKYSLYHLLLFPLDKKLIFLFKVLKIILVLPIVHGISLKIQAAV